MFPNSVNQRLGPVFCRFVHLRSSVPIICSGLALAYRYDIASTDWRARVDCRALDHQHRRFSSSLIISPGSADPFLCRVDDRGGCCIALATVQKAMACRHGWRPEPLENLAKNRPGNIAARRRPMLADGARATDWSLANSSGLFCVASDRSVSIISTAGWASCRQKLKTQLRSDFLGPGPFHRKSRGGDLESICQPGSARSRYGSLLAQIGIALALANSPGRSREWGLVRGRVSSAGRARWHFCSPLEARWPPNRLCQRKSALFIFARHRKNLLISLIDAACLQARFSVAFIQKFGIYSGLGAICFQAAAVAGGR